jgi:hypothetical protein
MDANNQANAVNQANDRQMEQLLRRFRSKNDLYRYLNESIVSTSYQYVTTLYFHIHSHISLPVASLSATLEGMYTAVYAVNPGQSEELFPQELSQTLEDSDLARAECV